jgi:hypothetical protein
MAIDFSNDLITISFTSICFPILIFDGVSKPKRGRQERALQASTRSKNIFLVLVSCLRLCRSVNFVIEAVTFFHPLANIK